MAWEKKKILVTVKTYPNLSEKYQELVCTAGVLEDGSWIRLYPIPFRLMEYEAQYKKYHWIEVSVEKSKEDPRPESYKPDLETIKVVGEIYATDNWRHRKQYVLKNVQENMEKLIELAHDNKLSLATFRPKKILGFEHKEVAEKELEQYQEKMRRILEARKQMNLIDDELRKVMPVSKPDYRFYYKFEDDVGKESRMMIEDWEIQALYRKCLKKNKKDKEKALEDVCKTYQDEFLTTKDLYLFLGTTKEHHVRRHTNPFMIVGVFYPQKESQLQLL